MNANRIRIVKDDIDKFVNIPINMQWDFTGKDDAIDGTVDENVHET